MQTPNDPYRNHKLGALTLAALLTLFLGYSQYRAAPPPAAPPPPAPAAPVVKKKIAAVKKKTAVAAVKHPRGERLREKGESLLGGHESLEKADADKEEQ